MKMIIWQHGVLLSQIKFIIINLREKSNAGKRSFYQKESDKVKIITFSAK